MIIISSTPRKTVFELLIRMDKANSYSNIILDNTISRDKLNSRDRAFATVLFYGVLERKMTLDFIIRRYSNVEFDKISSEAVQALRMGIYQLLYMDSVPDNAAVNESVMLVTPKLKGFVNAIMRSFIRDNKIIDTRRYTGEHKLSIEYSCPKWLVKKWIVQYGEEKTTEILKSSFGRPPLYIRVNTHKFQVNEVIEELKNEKIEAKRNSLIEECLEITKLSSGIETTNCFRRGMFHVQDISSQICCKIVKPVFNETVIDLCSAPGGKTFTMAGMMNNKGRLISCDLYGGKLSLLEEGKKRLSLDFIETVENDASVLNKDFPLADKVLCDVPCSGLGVIRRKPEIKYKPMDSLKDLPEIQKKILDTAANYVKPNGTLIYSTCTLNRDENEYVVKDFQRNHPEFSPFVVPAGISGVPDVPIRTFFPHITGGDGFFVATFRKKI